jgi:hypothetical protein
VTVLLAKEMKRQKDTWMFLGVVLASQPLWGWEFGHGGQLPKAPILIKNNDLIRCQWLMLIILATWEAEIGRIAV